MRILVVEDDLDFAEILEQQLSPIVGQNNLVIVQSRDSAFKVLKTEYFDLAILDLKIPIADGHLDKDIKHGQAVYETIKHEASGTPVYFLTAFGTIDFTAGLLEVAAQDDIWGDRTLRPLVRMFGKSEISELIRTVADQKVIIDETDNIEISGGLEGVHLSGAENRILRIFSRRYQGASVHISKFPGGLSGAVVLHVQVNDEHGITRIYAVAKIGEIDQVDDEVKRYREEVIRLYKGYPTLIDIIRTGAGRKAGVFYSLLEGDLCSLFDLIKSRPAEVIPTLSEVKQILEPWSRNVPTQSKTIKQIRQRMIDDNSLEGHINYLNGIPWIEFEEREILVRWCCQHGDLHGGNILIGHSGDPMIIDFGEVDYGPAALDPISIELSILFHPEGVKLLGDWPSLEASELWGDIDVYLDGCDYTEFVRAARQWAVEVAAGNREILATAYAYCVRQLKYPDTNKERTVAIIKSVIEMFK